MKTTGYLRVQNGTWRMVFQYPDSVTGKLRQQSKSTGLPERGNKRKAQEMLNQRLAELNKKPQLLSAAGDTLFLDYMNHWLTNIMSHEVKENTLSQYRMVFNGYIAKYEPFVGVKMKDLTRTLMQSYFNTQLQAGLSPNTVRKHYANIHKCLQLAVQQEVINANPADYMQLGKKKKYDGAKPLELEEAKQVERLFKGDLIETPVKLALYFGLRRSEACGLMWQDVDLEHRVLYIRHTAIVDNGKVVYALGTKTESSSRPFAISESMYLYLSELKTKQEANRALFGADYHESDLVCVQSDGTPVSPNTVTHHFQRKLKANEMRVIRFHDLRHTTVKILHNAGVDIKTISDFLGHSEVGTTANIYGGILREPDQATCDAMEAALA